MADNNDHHSEAPKGEDYKIEVDNDEVADSFSFGAMSDNPNYRRLFFWSTLGLAVFVLFLFIIIGMFDVNKYLTDSDVSTTSTYYQLAELEDKEEEILNSFGVVDDEKNIYRIPIDSAINQYVQEANQQ